MGNCQAAEAATVLIQHPGSNKVERFYRSLNAQEVMSSNPGYYVAMMVTTVPAAAVREKKRSSAYKSADQNIRQLKLLKPDDTLHIGHVYRLVSFEDVLKEFSAKKSVKLGKLLKENKVVVSNISCTGFDKRNRKQRKKKKISNQCDSTPAKKDDEQVEDTNDRGLESSSIMSMPTSIATVSSRRLHQWTPALQTIAEVA